MGLIARVPGDAVDRIAWSLDYLGRTIYYNGYWKDFRSDKASKRRLKEPGFLGDRTAIRQALEAGLSSVDWALEQVAGLGLAHLPEASRAAAWQQWQVVEATLNARLRTAFALARPVGLARAFERLFPPLGSIAPLHLACIPPARDVKGRYGIPDVLLEGDDLVLLIEMKVRGLTSARKYDPRQMLQYMSLAADELAASPGKRVVHLLLSPTYGGRSCWKPSVWWPEAAEADGAIRMRAATLRRLATPQRWAPAFDLERSLTALQRVPVFERRYADLATSLPESVWSGGAPGSIGAHELRTVVRLAEPRRHRAPA